MGKRFLVTWEGLERSNYERTEKKFPVLSDLYSHLKDKYIEIKMKLEVQKEENKWLRQHNEALKARAFDAEERLYQIKMNQIRKS